MYNCCGAKTCKTNPATARMGNYRGIEMIDSVVAKMACNSIETSRYDKAGVLTYVKVKLGAVYGTEGENKDFSNATPSGECWMQIDAGRPAAEFFEPGERYYVTFTKAPK